jgi:hypothetical protein
MNDPRKGLPPDAATMTFDQISIKSCMDDIAHSLKKYNCTLIFQQVHRNGMPAEPGMFHVVKNKEENNKPIIEQSH